MSNMPPANQTDALDDVLHAIDRLQEHLKAGCVIAFQDDRWWLFAKNGEGIVSGVTFKKMLVELAMLE